MMRGLPRLPITPASGPRYQAGVDEAGRGALAGPVVAAAVVLPPDLYDGPREVADFASRIRDSKRLTPRARAALRPFIEAHALAWAVAAVDAAAVDADNILVATMRAMHGALAALPPGAFDAIAVDGDRFPPFDAAYAASAPPPPRGLTVLAAGGRGRPPPSTDAGDADTAACGRGAAWEGVGACVPHECFVGGDDAYACIAAASVLAKEHRDALMRRAAAAEPARYGAYGWDSNVGYGTAAHFAALRAHGASDLHRRSFLGRVRT